MRRDQSDLTFYTHVLHTCCTDEHSALSLDGAPHKIAKVAAEGAVAVAVNKGGNDGVGGASGGGDFSSNSLDHFLMAQRLRGEFRA